MAAQRRGVRRAAWLAVVTLPPVGLGAVFLHWWQDHLASTAGLILAYAAGLVARPVVHLVEGVWGKLKDPIETHVARRIEQRFTDPGYEKHYREHRLDNIRHVNQRGLKTAFAQPLELDTVFVDVSLVRPLRQTPSGLLVHSDLLRDVPERERRSIGDFLDREKPVPLAIIGEAGSGKTTLLQRTARQVCESDGRHRPVPVLLYLRDHFSTIVSDPHVGLAQVVGSLPGNLPPGEPDRWLERQLERGRCLILLDGLDEVPRTVDRAKVSDWVAGQIRQYPRNDYVITARPHGYWTAPLDDAAVLQVEPFTDDQVEQFVHNWYLAIERHFTGDKGAALARQRAEADAKDLLQRLNDAPALHELTSNPLLLTMIANVHRERSPLPESRAELYEEICEVLLWRLHAARGVHPERIPAELRGEQRMLLLQELAFTMMDRRVRDLARDEILDVMTSTLERVNVSVDAAAFLDAATASGLLFEREHGVYAFAHITFQEYLAAAHIRDPSVLTAVVDSPWWRETIVLYAARSNADPIVEACLANGSALALTLALDCADQARELNPDLRERLEDLKRHLKEANAPSVDAEGQISLIDKVKIAADLSPLIHVADGSLVCPQPFGAENYSLFLQDMRGRGARWADDELDRTGAGTAGEVATGMRGSDARAFVQWLTERLGRGVVYRLPTRAAIVELVKRRALDPSTRSIWVASADGGTELWIPTGRPHPHTVEPEMLREHLETDLRSPAVLQALLLTRSHLALSGLARDLASAIDLLSQVRRIRDLPLARDLASDLERVRTLAHELGGDLASAHRLAAAAVSGLARVRTLAQELTGAMDDVHTRAEALKGVGDIAHVGFTQHSTAIQPTLDRARRLAEDDLSSAVRTALAGSLSDLLRRPSSLRLFGDGAAVPLDDRAGRLIEDLGVTAATHVVSPDTLTGRTNGALDAVRRLRDTPGQHAAFWMLRVADELASVALPVLERERPLHPGTAGAIRVAAVCLATATAHSASQGGDEDDLSRAFQEIAAGVTLIERRRQGQAPPTETIHVALA